MMTQSVLEGVAFGLRDSAEAMKKNGTVIQTLYAIGGGARSTYWLKLIATVLNIPLQVPRDGEYGAALGAARLAKIAVTGETVDSVIVSPKNTEEITPVAELVELFDQQYFAFQSGYPALKSL
jgi:xylulokinase